MLFSFWLNGVNFFKILNHPGIRVDGRADEAISEGRKSDDGILRCGGDRACGDDSTTASRSGPAGAIIRVPAGVAQLVRAAES
jgi:hypothetical protein